jgi:hypothetical protein
MNFSSCPTMNMMSVHDLHFDEDFLTSIGHDMNRIGNVNNLPCGAKESIGC